jgi:hypothetical protein
MSQRSVGLGRKEGEAPDQPARTAAYPFRAAASTRRQRFWEQDGAWLDQNGYGTCVAHASAHRIADRPREQLPGQIDNEWAFKLYRDATGDASMQDGTWAHVVAEELLRRQLILRFEWITSPEAFDYAVKERGSVLIGVPWYDPMFDPYLGEDGHAWLDCSPGNLAGGHEILVNGVRTAPVDGRPWWRPFYRIKNSWGRWWGEGGTARIACEDLHRLVFEEWGDAVVLREAA